MDLAIRTSRSRGKGPGEVVFGTVTAEKHVSPVRFFVVGPRPSTDGHVLPDAVVRLVSRVNDVENGPLRRRIVRSIGVDQRDVLLVTALRIVARRDGRSLERGSVGQSDRRKGKGGRLLRLVAGSVHLGIQVAEGTWPGVLLGCGRLRRLFSRSLYRERCIPITIHHNASCGKNRGSRNNCKELSSVHT